MTRGQIKAQNDRINVATVDMMSSGGEDMEWLTSLRQAINYMEKHLLDDITAEDVAVEVNISPFYLQNGFRAILIMKWL